MQEHRRGLVSGELAPRRAAAGRPVLGEPLRRHDPAPAVSRRRRCHPARPGDGDPPRHPHALRARARCRRDAQGSCGRDRRPELRDAELSAIYLPGRRRRASAATGRRVPSARAARAVIGDVVGRGVRPLGAWASCATPTAPTARGLRAGRETPTASTGWSRRWEAVRDPAGAVVDLESGHVRYASAGHRPPPTTEPTKHARRRASWRRRSAPGWTPRPRGRGPPAPRRGRAVLTPTGRRAPHRADRRRPVRRRRVADSPASAATLAGSRRRMSDAERPNDARCSCGPPRAGGSRSSCDPPRRPCWGAARG